jgi:hypothetical protein
MGHEISQFDIPDRQLMAGSGQARMWSDIGEAKITHSIFGVARVRVIREKDKVVRAWLLAALLVIALAVAAWQGWIALQQSKLLAATPPLSERISIGAPVFHPEIMPPAKAAGRGKSESLIQTEIDSLVSNPNARPPRPPALNANKPEDAIPVAAQPAMTGNTQPAPLATNNGSSLNQTTTQPHSKMSTPGQPAVPAVATPPAEQPSANKPAPAAPPAEPLTRKDTSKPSSASNDQQTEVNAQLVNAPTQVNARGTAIIYEQPDNAKP